MSQHPRFNEQTYKRHFTPEKVAFLQANWQNWPDRKIAHQLNIPKDIVAGYRVDVLKVMKQRHKQPDLTFRHDKSMAKDELEALEAYQYNGAMKESVIHRIEYLKCIIG